MKLKRILELINGSVLMLMFLVTITQVFFRVILKIPASWSEELARYFFVALVFIGSVNLIESDSHISISLLMDRLPERGKKILRITGRILIMPFLILFVGGAYINMISTWSAFLPTVEWIRIGYIYLLLLVTGSLSVVYLFLNLVSDLFNSSGSNNITDGNKND